MEVGLSYNLGPVYQVNKPSYFGSNEVNFIEVSPQFSGPYYPRKLETLNSTCMTLNTSPTVFITGAKPNSAPLTYGLTNPGMNEYKRLHSFLKSIPIYNEVLEIQTQELAASYSTNGSNPNVQTTFINEQGNSPSLSIPRKRMTSETFSEISKLPRPDSPVLSQIQTGSVISNSHSTSTLIFEKEAIRKMYQPIEEDVVSHGTQPGSAPIDSPKVNNYYQTQSGMRRYKPVIISEGSPALLPPGYIQVQKESNCNRKTKFITNCRHTNRKHYAKGLCSTCYHKTGRTKLSWNCKHTDQLHYAKGCCQECYLTFHSKRGKSKLRKMLNDQSVSLSELLQQDGQECASLTSLA